MDKGAAKKTKAPADPNRTCADCGATRWKPFAKCEVCGKPKCGKCGVRGRSKACTDCGGSLKKKATKPAGKKPGAAWRTPFLKKPAAAPAPAAAALPQGKKKCEGCAKPAEDFAKCETCGAAYCTARCLKESKDCPACRSLTRGED